MNTTTQMDLEPGAAGNGVTPVQSARLLRLAEVADRLRCSRSALYERHLAPRGPLPVIRLSPGSVRVSERDLNIYVATLERAARETA